MNEQQVRELVEKKFDDYAYDSEYAEWLMDGNGFTGIWGICNSETLINAQEDSRNAEMFIDHMIDVIMAEGE